MAVDVTLRFSLNCAESVEERSGLENGSAPKEARSDKERAYREIVQSNRCELVVVGLDTGGLTGVGSVGTSISSPSTGTDSG